MCVQSKHFNCTLLTHNYVALYSLTGQAEAALEAITRCCASGEGNLLDLSIQVCKVVL